MIVFITQTNTTDQSCFTKMQKKTHRFAFFLHLVEFSFGILEDNSDLFPKNREQSYEEAEVFI